MLLLFPQPGCRRVFRLKCPQTKNTFSTTTLSLSGTFGNKIFPWIPLFKFMHKQGHTWHNIFMKKDFILCGLTGWCMEVLWTGLCSMMSRDPKLTCKTSIWMFPIYGMASFLSPMCRHLKGKNLMLRGGVYTLCIFAAEFTTGSILKKYQVCPWDYSGQKTNIRGLIKLNYAPLWFGAGLFFEKLLSHPE